MPRLCALLERSSFTPNTIICPRTTDNILQLASWRNSCDVSLLPHDLTLRVLVKYHDKYGDLVIPRRFTVELPKFSCSVWFSTVLALDILLWLLLSRNVLRE